MPKQSNIMLRCQVPNFRGLGRILRLHMDVPATLPEQRYISKVLAHCPINSRRVFTSGGVKCNRHVRLRLAKLPLKIESRIFNSAGDKASMIKVAPAQLKRLVRDLEYSGGQGVCRTKAKNKDVSAG
jgi:hypothetical protein